MAPKQLSPQVSDINLNTLSFYVRLITSGFNKETCCHLILGSVIGTQVKILRKYMYLGEFITNNTV